MTNKEKQLLLKDLCARFPYGVIVRGIFINYNKEKDKILYEECDKELNIQSLTNNESIKPYLRPMSSMTEEEGERLEQIAKETLGDFMFEAEEDGGAIYHMTQWKTLSPAMFDYLNSIHIDYRGLIEIGLAFEAPENMYH